MKFSAQEEYGLRCLLRVGKNFMEGRSSTIPEISKDEELSQHNVAKILRVLRIGGILESERGHTGGYTLARSPEEITIGEALEVLGGRLYDDDFCSTHAGAASICTNSVDCSLRSLWRVIQESVDGVVNKLKLSDLLGKEDDFFAKFLSYNSEVSSD